MTLNDLTHEIFRTARFGPAACRDLARALLAEKRRAVRKARGVTIGWVAVAPQRGGHPAILLSTDSSSRVVSEALAAAEDGEVARLVAVPRRRKPR